MFRGTSFRRLNLPAVLSGSPQRLRDSSLRGQETTVSAALFLYCSQSLSGRRSAVFRGTSSRRPNLPAVQGGSPQRLRDSSLRGQETTVSAASHLITADSFPAVVPPYSVAFRFVARTFLPCGAVPRNVCGTRPCGDRKQPLPRLRIL